jgi:hypothetical protein
MVFSKNESDFADYYYFKGDSSQLDIFFKDKYTSINDFNYKKKNLVYLNLYGLTQKKDVCIQLILPI